MIDFTNPENQSNLVYTTSSIQSTSSIHNGSAITTSSTTSVTSSVNSSEPVSSVDPLSLSFLTENQHHYFQLLEDLSIVDNMQDTFDFESESNLFGNKIKGDWSINTVANRSILLLLSQ